MPSRIADERPAVTMRACRVASRVLLLALLAATGVFAAVQCAVDIQRDIATANRALDEGRRILFRIGSPISSSAAIRCPPFTWPFNGRRRGHGRQGRPPFLK